MTQEIESVPVAIDMAGLTSLQRALRRANRCPMTFHQANKPHRCYLAASHPGYHFVNEWGVLYWAHPLQAAGQATEEFMSQITRGEAIMLRAAGQTEEDMRKLSFPEMDYSVPCGRPRDLAAEVTQLRERVEKINSEVSSLRRLSRESE